MEFINYGSYGMAELMAYLWIKQSVCVSHVFVNTVQSIVGSWRKMEVHVWRTRHDNNSQQAAPNEYEPHGLLLKWKSAETS